jgi:TusA-related sulfurtransferase
MATETTLDVRGLEPPEPMVKVLDALETMPPGDSLRMVHNREPFPLYGILQQDGYQYRTETFADGHFEIVIWR